MPDLVIQVAIVCSRETAHGWERGRLWDAASPLAVVEIAIGDGTQAWEAVLADDAPSLAILAWMRLGLQAPEIFRRVLLAPGGDVHRGPRGEAGVERNRYVLRRCGGSAQCRTPAACA